ncbi:MAG: hypothetical protein KDB80_15785 [Planctomycetes bacterium]|nr:hypothetical protein [Planctomycetota bacterium]
MELRIRFDEFSRRPKAAPIDRFVRGLSVQSAQRIAACMPTNDHEWWRLPPCHESVWWQSSHADGKRSAQWIGFAVAKSFEWHDTRSGDSGEKTVPK